MLKVNGQRHSEHKLLIRTAGIGSEEYNLLESGHVAPNYAFRNH